MQYIVYPDLLFVENFFCNLLFLIFLKSLLFPISTWKKIFCGSLMTAVCNTLVSILFFRSAGILKIGVLMPASGIMICHCMEVYDKRRILYLLYQITIWTLVLGGVIQSMNQNILLSIVVFVIIFGILEKIMKIYRQQNDCMKEVALYMNNRCCHIKGFADTGNQLRDPISKKPVSVITETAWINLMQDTKEPLHRLIPYKTVGNPHGFIETVQIDYMVIVQGSHSQIIKQPILAITKQPFTGIFHYSILLHSDFC